MVLAVDHYMVSAFTIHNDPQVLVLKIFYFFFEAFFVRRLEWDPSLVFVFVFFVFPAFAVVSN